LDLRSFLRLMRDRWKVITAVALLAGVASGVLTWRMTPLYASSVTFYVSAQNSQSSPADAYQGSLLSQQEVQSFADLLTGPALPQHVISDLGLQESPGEVAAGISAHPIPQTVLLTATVTNRSPQQAQRIAAAVGAQFTKLVAQLERPQGNGSPAVAVTVVAAAGLPQSPVSPDRVRNVGLGLGLGLLAGIGIAVAARSLDNTIKTVDHLSAVTEGRPVLGSVPFDPQFRKRPLIADDDPFSARVEAFRKLRLNLQFVDVDHPQKVVLVTSPLPEEGKSTTVCNLAVALAQDGSRVIVIEADLRRPRTVRYLGLPEGSGLTSVLLGRASEADVTQAWGDDLFNVISSGPLPPNPATLLGSGRMRELIERLRRGYDYVLIDAPPVLPFADTPTVAPFCDGAIVVVRYGRTRIDQVRRTIAALTAVDSPILGSLLTMTPRGRSSEYGYAYYNAAGHDDVKADGAGPAGQHGAAAR
jgi:capsular exopolysaccharide synthesis family protein